MTRRTPYDPTAPFEAPASPSTSRRTFGCLFEIVETLVLTVVIFLVIQTFVAQPYQVRQQSMENTFEQGDYVLVDKLTPHFDTYKRGDIVVFEPPAGWATEGDRTPFIKRVIGVAGDTLELRDGHVLVNGTQLEEPYLFAVDGVAQPTDPTSGQSRWVVPAGEIFVMGDHREASADSRMFGTIRVSDVIGRAWLRYWPIAKLGILVTPRYGSLSTAPSALPAPAASGLVVAPGGRAAKAA